MTDDEFFRLFLLAGAALLLPVALYHRLRSSASGERLDRTQEGVALMLTLRLAGLAHILAVLTFTLHPPYMGWSSLRLPAWARWVGVVFGGAAVLLSVWTLRALGPNLTDTVQVREKAYLVTSGPYRWVRHPFYVACTLAFLGNSLVTANWFVALTGLLALACLAVRTPIEEARLADRFGDDYREYCRRTGQFFPKLGRG